MSHRDFCRLSAELFAEIVRAHEEEQRGEWERARMQTAWMLQPFVKGSLDPLRHFPLPWDNDDRQSGQKTQRAKLTREESYQRYLKIRGKLDGKAQ